jgi:hypothetical protein
VNNAGASWRGTFADTGTNNLNLHMRLNFEAQVRLIEALLPLLRRTAAARAGGAAAAGAAGAAAGGAAGTAAGGPAGRKAEVAIVNVSSTAEVRGLLREQVRARRMERRALRRGATARRSRRPRPSRLRLDGGLPAARTARASRQAPDPLHPGRSRRGDPRGRPGRAARTLRPALLLGRRGRADPGAPPRSARDRARLDPDRDQARHRFVFLIPRAEPGERGRRGRGGRSRGWLVGRSRAVGRAVGRSRAVDGPGIGPAQTSNLGCAGLDCSKMAVRPARMSNLRLSGLICPFAQVGPLPPPSPLPSHAPGDRGPPHRRSCNLH